MDAWDRRNYGGGSLGWNLSSSIFKTKQASDSGGRQDKGPRILPSIEILERASESFSLVHKESEKQKNLEETEGKAMATSNSSAYSA